jgi:hypothetical protein
MTILTDRPGKALPGCRCGHCRPVGYPLHAVTARPIQVSINAMKARHFYRVVRNGFGEVTQRLFDWEKPAVDSLADVIRDTAWEMFKASGYQTAVSL